MLLSASPSGNNLTDTAVTVVDLGPSAALNPSNSGIAITNTVVGAMSAAQVAADALAATGFTSGEAQRTAVTAIAVARNFILYGVAVNGAALEGVENSAPAGGIVPGPKALLSAVQVAGWQAQYTQARGYILRALTNTQIGSV